MHWLELILSRLRIRLISFVETLLVGPAESAFLDPSGMGTLESLVLGSLCAFAVAFSIRRRVEVDRRAVEVIVPLAPEMHLDIARGGPKLLSVRGATLPSSSGASLVLRDAHGRSIALRKPRLVWSWRTRSPLVVARTELPAAGRYQLSLADASGVPAHTTLLVSAAAGWQRLGWTLAIVTSTLVTAGAGLRAVLLWSGP